jgi:lipoate-protein ligase A
VRGEYKVPGGKLVAADVEVVDGTLAQVSVSGDFFLEPDAALGVIDAALTGRPADARVADLTTAIEDALHRAEHDGTLDTPVEMIGFSAESVAIAVRRALGHATGWQDHTFEVIHPGPLPPAVLGALDQVLTEELAAGRRGPTLRFWEWEERAVFIGSFQSLRNEQSYRFLDDWVIGALAEVGVRASFAGLNDVASPAGKIAGSAQKRLAGGAVLHHMTMAYDIDADKMLEVLRIGREKLSDKGTTSANKRVDPVRSQTGLPREKVIEAFDAYFRSRYRAVDGELRPEELARAEQLVTEKFGNPEWTARVP